MTRRDDGRIRVPGQAARRYGFLGLIVLTTGGGAWTMLRTMAGGGISPLEAVILALFVVTFGWIAVPFWTAVAGFVLRLLDRDPLTLEALGSAPTPDGGGSPASTPDGSRTALVMPVYNEDPEAVAARLGAVAGSVAETGRGARFDVHLLSDTSDPALARREEAAWARLQGAHPEIAFFYRRRSDNRGRKAGNLAEFCRRCADRYNYMVVLDADSLMAGDTLVRLVDRMDADPTVGLIQTVPLPIRQRTLFGRLVQFAATLHAPMLASGLAFWQGDTANYWGHNAIVRMRAFAEDARLPVLPGTPPLGGEILSHDFVEAALLRAAGWRVLLDATLGGSWEELPATLPDFLRRDRRWAEGSLQHLRLLARPGLRPLSRLHFMLGAMGYLSSPLWLLFLVAGTAWVIGPEPMGSVTLGVPPPDGPLSLLTATAVLLFGPKLLGLLLALRRTGGGRGVRRRLLVGTVFETTASILLAPLFMVAHSRIVAQIVRGRAVSWTPQTRDGRTLSWRSAIRAGAPATLLGVGWTAAILATTPAFLPWMSPILTGLLLSAPLLRWSSSPAWGEATRRFGLLETPVERTPPAEVRAVARASVRPDAADPRRVTGVQGGMLNAERGLFDLRRGRPLLVRSSGPSPRQAALVAAVEGITDEKLRSLRELSGHSPDLVITRHRATAMGLPPSADPAPHRTLRLPEDLDAATLVELASGPVSRERIAGLDDRRTSDEEGAGLDLARLARMLPAVVTVPAGPPLAPALARARAEGTILEVDPDEARVFVEAAGAEVERVSEAPVPLAQAEDSRFILFREACGLGEHVAILVGSPASWPDPVPVRLHSACLTGDLFGSLRCDCGEQLRGSLAVFEERGGGVLLYLAQEGRGIGLGNKFRAYTLQECGLDTIDADSTLGFGADERRYDIAAGILQRLGVRRVDLLTNNPEKVEALQQSGIVVERRSPLHGQLNRHNLPYVRAKVHRAGHWLRDMLSQPLAGD